MLTEPEIEILFDCALATNKNVKLALSILLIAFPALLQIVDYIFPQNF